MLVISISSLSCNVFYSTKDRSHISINICFSYHLQMLWICSCPKLCCLVKGWNIDGSKKLLFCKERKIFVSLQWKMVEKSICRNTWDCHRFKFLFRVSIYSFYILFSFAVCFGFCLFLLCTIPTINNPAIEAFRKNNGKMRKCC